MNNAVGSDLRLTCRRCGKSIELSVGTAGPQIEDARAFLDTHEHCLAADH
ncbi:MAG TPA: hypothetical protein VKJ07_17215 [Mycobacteriales bacterium]|nr:hypothetical protein [Mycobacteriales bacterium]